MIVENLKKVNHFFKLSITKKKFSSFFFFFAVSLSFWFLTVLSKIHETTIVIPVSYFNYPNDLIVVDSLEDYIEVRVKSSGISIVTFNLFNNSQIDLNLNLAYSKPKGNSTELFFNLNSNRQKISSILGPSFEILDVSPSKLILNFAKRASKYVPIYLDHDVTLKQSFWFSSEISLSSNKVLIFGKQDALDLINNISTSKLVIANLDTSCFRSVPLKIPEGIFCDSSTVFVNIKVASYVEDNISKKVNIRNLEEDYNLKLFPSNVIITLRVAKENFSLLETDFIDVFVDANRLINQKYLEVQFEKLPNGVKIERIYPNQLEYLLIKD